MPSTFFIYSRVLRFTACFLLGQSFGLYAQETAEKEISEDVSAGFGSLRALTDAKDYAGSVALLEALAQKAKPGSFDFALIAQIKAQILLADGKLALAIDPLETSLKLGEQHRFFEPSVLSEKRYLLAQLYYQTGAESKDLALQRKHYESAQEMLRAWFSATPRPSAEAHLFAASLLYHRATLGTGEPDAALLREARVEAERGLVLQPKADPQFYVLILAAIQQLGDFAGAAETLELLVKHQPGSVTYWQQLAATYLNLATDAKDESASFRYHLRAILTLERAQAVGLLNSSKDRLNLVGIYFNIRRFDQAALLLEKGLAEGSIEPQRGNWELLASAYQQQRQDDRAVETYERAIRALPLDGQCELGLAQLHYNQGRAVLAYRHLEAAGVKTGIKKPGQAKLFAAYVACELQRYEDAARWIEAAAGHDDLNKDDLVRLDRAVRDALRERTALREIKL
jgi:tetratricopeptide (TPR) repeat protein